MKSVPLTAFPRTLARRSGVKKLRAAGRVPAVVYGRQRQPQNLEIKLKELEDLVHHSASENILVNLSVQGDTQPNRLALVQEVQHHALSGKVLHVDLHEVAEDERVTITVPVETTGEPVGVKTSGGVLEHVLFRLRVRALPKDLPEMIVVDVSHLDIGHAIHIGEITAPPGVELLGDKHISVIAVSAPISEAQEAAAEAAAAETTLAEPEVLREKKEEGEAAEAKPGEKVAEKPGEKGAAKPAEKGAAKPAAAKATAGKPAAEKPAAAEKKPEKKK
jgi:large subunit ribosomal protein L25